MLNNPMVWWSFLAICLYVVDCIIKYSPPLKKWRASKNGSPPPPWAITIQNLSYICLSITTLPAIIASVCWFNNKPLFPDITLSKFWLAIIIMSAVVSFVKFMIQHVTAVNAKLLSKYLDGEARNKIRERCEDEVRECEGALRRCGLGDSTWYATTTLAKAKKMLKIVAE